MYFLLLEGQHQALTLCVRRNFLPPVNVGAANRDVHCLKKVGVAKRGSGTSDGEATEVESGIRYAARAEHLNGTGQKIPEHRVSCSAIVCEQMQKILIQSLTEIFRWGICWGQNRRRRRRTRGAGSALSLGHTRVHKHGEIVCFTEFCVRMGFFGPHTCICQFVCIVLFQLPQLSIGTFEK